MRRVSTRLHPCNCGPNRKGGQATYSWSTRRSESSPNRIQPVKTLAATGYLTVLSPASGKMRRNRALNFSSLSPSSRPFCLTRPSITPGLLRRSAPRSCRRGWSSCPGFGARVFTRSRTAHRGSATHATLTLGGAESHRRHWLPRGSEGTGATTSSPPVSAKSLLTLLCPCAVEPPQRRPNPLVAPCLRAPSPRGDPRLDGSCAGRY